LFYEALSTAMYESARESVGTYATIIHSPETIKHGQAMYGWAVAYFFAIPLVTLLGASIVHSLAWTLFWIAAGFKESKGA
jgi:hypothetical protein